MSELKVTTLKHADSTVDSIVMASDGTLAFGAAVADSAGVAVKGGVPAQAWVNFNGTGTVAIRRAFNVSTITDIAVGEYQINFAVAMSDSNYASAITASDVTYGAVPYLYGNTGDASTTSCRFFIRSNYTGTPPAGDPGTCHVTFFS